MGLEATSQVARPSPRTAMVGLPPAPGRISVVGVGLLGSSVLRAARAAWPQVSLVACDVDAEARRYVGALGIGAAVFPDVADIADAEMIVICTPPSAVLPVVRALRVDLKPPTVVTDVASVKSQLVHDIGLLLPEGVYHVSVHPMAGGPFGGASAGHADLFADRSCILTPRDGTPDAIIHRVEDFWRALGAVPGRSSPERHDDLVALTSHLPHLVAYAMMETMGHGLLEQQSRMFVGRSLEDLIRAGSADPVIWRDIFQMNAARVLEHLDVFEASLRVWRKALTERSDPAVAACIGRAAAFTTRHRAAAAGGA